MSAAHQQRVNDYFQAVSGYWKEVYEREDIYGATYQDRASKVMSLVEELALPAGTRVLELGCGAGRTAVALAQRGYKVDAVDTAPAMVDLARGLAEQAGVASNLSVGVADVDNLPFADGTFQLVLAIGVLPWLSSLAPPLEKMTRLLASGGYLIVTVDQRWGLAFLLDPLLHPVVAPLKALARRLLRRKPKTLSVRHSQRELEGALQAAGVRKLQSASLGFGPFTFCYRRLFSRSIELLLHHRLQAWAERGVPVIRSAGTQYIVVAKKD